MDKQSIGITLPRSYIGLSMYAIIRDETNAQVGSNNTSGFFEHGEGYYTFIHDFDYGTVLHGSVTFYDVSDDSLLASTEVNSSSAQVPFIATFGESTRQRDIDVFVATDSNHVWRLNSSVLPTEVVFTIKEDNTDLVEDATLIVSMTNGCERVNGELASDASLASIYTDDNFVYVAMSDELTVQFASPVGSQQYDLKSTIEGAVITKGYGLVNFVLGGTP